MIPGLFLAGIRLKLVLNIRACVMGTTGSPFRAQMRWHLPPYIEWLNLLTIHDPSTFRISDPSPRILKNVGPDPVDGLF